MKKLINDVGSVVREALEGLVALNPQLALLEERYMQGARRITLDAWRRRPFAQELAQNLARLVSPLL